MLRLLVFGRAALMRVERISTSAPFSRYLGYELPGGTDSGSEAQGSAALKMFERRASGSISCRRRPGTSRSCDAPG